MEFYLSSPEIGPYILTCAAELAAALAAGHTLLPHEDAYMGALHGWSEMKQEAAAHMAKAERNREIDEAFENLEEPDYSSPEYVGKPVFEETEVETSVPVTPAKKVWTRDDIKALVKRNDDAVDRAMVALSKRDDLPPWQVDTVEGYARWVSRGNNLSGRFLKKARALALRNSHKLEEIANA